MDGNVMSDDLAAVVRLTQAFRDVLTDGDYEAHVVAHSVGTLVGGVCLMSDNPERVFEAIGNIARNTIHHAPAVQLAAAVKARHAN